MKVAVLSFAHVHAAGYLRLLSRMPGVEVIGSDPDQDLAAPGEVRGRALADEVGVAYAPTYEEAFAWGPDAVIVCSENARHRPLVERAALHGVSVLCEKPLAASVADGEAMVEACRAAGVRLAVAFPVRFSPAYAAVKAAVASGEAGRVLAVSGANNGSMPNRARRWFAEPELSGGGALMDHTVHIADLLDDLFGDARPVEVYAQTNNLLHADEVAVETAGLVSVTYSDGAVATIDCSWSHPRSHHSWGGLELTVVGERATLEMDAFDQKVHGFDERRGRGTELPFGADLDELMLRAFLYGPEEGGIDVADGEGGLRTLRVVAAAYASAESGAPVAVG
ncbi:gfo/Idh/MocA family oxidoreductase [Streptomyces alfalfae]|uniref:Dehydrogenase n=1 Tax=Streptomyces alfalfae TaxID=1642299 RepID=A0A1P8TBZ2_9ACTN|nr:Gfo/Idh/MocA family oxidoreductase [Streptomyces alfalfae]AYA15496.1 gfo/Idh/MocA family oxidoreductase [Streptomyces fradiae]APY85150.1 dehydrogenase [Streptomyces alfalfae]QQC92540.1 Gfo/Idh/MocA family oxidoreductase [Streptomyces alfalfae]QUI35045.1 Gfo/Idh/MocA family oxidoreductase [Streptomyces alfalfae]RXX43839.1 gfo/Idh/MocA family oxidoreductase [Streptomyces alfalfae]